MAEWDIEKVVDQESLKNWLENAPMEADRVYVARSLAFRSAARVFPDCLPFHGNSFHTEGAGSLTLTCFRDLFYCWVRSRYPSWNIEGGGAYLDSEIYSGPIACASSIKNAAAACFSLPDVAARSAASAAASALSSDAAAHTIWKQIRADLTAISGARSNRHFLLDLWSPSVLKSAHGRSNFDRCERRVEAFPREINRFTPEWALVIEWYVHLLRNPNISYFGPNADLDLHLRGYKFWAREPSNIIKDIAAIVGWPDEINKRLLLDAQSEFLGRRWMPAGDSYVAFASTHKSDQEVAADPKTVEAHGRIREKIAAFASRAVVLEQTYGWDGFSAAWAQFEAAYARQTGDLPCDVERVYDVTVTLGSFLQMDMDLRTTAPSNNITQLNPPDRRAFNDLIRSVAPFLRRFPSAEKMDEATGSILYELPIEAAKSVLKTANDQRLLSEEQHRLLVSLLDAYQRGGLEGGRASKRGYHSIINFVMVMSVFLGSSVGSKAISDVADRSPLWKRSMDAISQSMPQVEPLIARLPDDLQAMLRENLERLKEQPEYPSEAPEAIADSRRKPEDEIY